MERVKFYQGISHLLTALQQSISPKKRQDYWANEHGQSIHVTNTICEKIVVKYNTMDLKEYKTTNLHKND